MNNIDKLENNKIVKELKESLEYKDRNLTNVLEGLNDNFSKSLKESKFQDKNLNTILEELSNSTGTYNKKLHLLLNDYKKGISKEDEKKVQELTNKLKLLEETKKKDLDLQRKKELNNPFNSIKYAYEDFKKSDTKKEGLSAGYNTLKKSLKDSKEEIGKNFNFKTLTKGLLHGAGVAFDLPALNILASEIKDSTKEQMNDNEKLLDLTEKLNKEDSDSSKEIIYNIQESLKENKDELQQVYDFSDKISKLNDLQESIYTEHGTLLEDIKGIDEETFTELGTILENIKNELEKQTDYLYIANNIQKDLADDNLVSKSTFKSSDTNFLKEPKDDKDSSGGLLDLLGGKKKGKITNLLKTGGSLLGKLALPLTAAVSVYEGFQGWDKANEIFNLKEGQEASLGQKSSSALGSIASGLTFGLLDEKSAAKSVYEFGNNIKSFFTGDDKEIKPLQEEIKPKETIKEDVFKNVTPMEVPRISQTKEVSKDIQPIVIKSESKKEGISNRITQYNLESENLVTLMTLKGIRL